MPETIAVDCRRKLPEAEWLSQWLRLDRIAVDIKSERDVGTKRNAVVDALYAHGSGTSKLAVLTHLHFDLARGVSLHRTITGGSVVRKYSGDKKSIEARSNDKGQTWSVKLFDSGRLTEYTGGTLAEVDALAAKHGMKLLSG